MADEQMKEDLFEIVLCQALREIEAEPYPEPQGAAAAEFSELHKLKMKKLFAAEKRKLRRKEYLRSLKYTAACAGLLVFISGAAVMSVSALRVRLLNFVFNTQGGNTEITANEDMQYGGYDTEALTIGYLPDGFVLDKQKTKDQMQYLRFVSSTARISFIMYPPDGKTSVDTEGIDYEELTINGRRCLYSNNNDDKILIICDNYHAVIVKSTINREEIVKIAQNLKIK